MGTFKKVLAAVIAIAAGFFAINLLFDIVSWLIGAVISLAIIGGAVAIAIPVYRSIKQKLLE